MKTVAIVQARMKSTRLPGKVMMDILGKPLIWYFLQRIKKAKEVDQIVLATSTDVSNDNLSAFVESIGFSVFRGSEDDVLDRYYQAAKIYQANSIVRVTGDCPLIDSTICDSLIQAFKNGDYDYAVTGPTFPEGADCEVFSFSVLEIMHKKAQLLSEHEHASLYIHNHKNEFKFFRMENNKDESKYRVTIDNAEDYQVVEKILEYFHANKHLNFSMRDVVQFLEAHEDIWKLNSHIIRNEGLLKSLKNDRVIKKRKND